MEEILQPSFIVLFTISGAYLGLSLGIMLLFLKSRQNKSNIYLGIFVLIFSLYLWPTALYRMNMLESFPHIIRVNGLNGFLIGPLMWLYIRSSTEKNFTFTPVLLLHFVPLLMDLGYQLPTFSLSGREKLQLFFDILNRGKIDQPNWLLALKTIHATAYCVLAIRLVILYKKNVVNNASYIDVTLHRWLLLFSCSLLFPIATIILFTFSGLTVVPVTFVAIAIFFFINSVYFATFLKPSLFRKFPHQITPQTKEEVVKEKYESSNLQEQQKEKLVEKLVAYVETEKPYQESELTLAELAGQVNIQPHYLSQIINQKLNCTFLDFINGYRVEAAKSMLRDEKYEHYTILATAYEAGFNSKTAFYSAFKKHTGTTPSGYRKSVVAA